MKKWFLLLLPLLLFGCARTDSDVKTEKRYVLVQMVSQSYVYQDLYPGGEPWSWTYQTSYAYDANGNRVEERTYSDGELESKTKYAYDGRGNLIREKSYDCSGFFPKLTWRTKYTWDEQGRMLGGVSYDGWAKDCWWTYTYIDGGHTRREESSDGVVWETTYNELDQITEQRRTAPDGTVTTYQSERLYDENGNCLSWQYYTDGILELVVEYTYDSQGRQTAVTQYDAEGNTQNTWEYVYNDEDQTATIIYSEGNYQIVFYDDDGNKVREVSYDKKDRITSQCDYTYRAIQVPVS